MAPLERPGGTFVVSRTLVSHNLSDTPLSDTPCTHVYVILLTFEGALQA